MTVARPSHKLILVVILVIGLLCVIVAGFGLWNYLLATGKEASVPTNEILSATNDQPSEKNPGPVTDEYMVPADQPRVIAIDSLGVAAYVQRVGIDKQKNMVAPNSVYFSGWYTGSVAPGEEGVSIINGHAGGRYVDGIFKHLAKLKKDDIVKIQKGDNTWQEFVVRSVSSYRVEDSARALFRDDPDIDHELHLITCDGVFDDRTQSYDKRIIVTAGLRRDT